MKGPFWILFSIILVIGCTSDDLVLKGKDLQFSSQKWVLVEMASSWVNSSTEGQEMEWQEYYIFNPDGSFLKSREQDGTVSEATGTFEMMEYDNDDSDYLELTFTTGKELATSCFSYEGFEILRYISNRKLESMWKACDGSDLYYDLVTD